MRISKLNTTELNISRLNTISLSRSFGSSSPEPQPIPDGTMVDSEGFYMRDSDGYYMLPSDN